MGVDDAICIEIIGANFRNIKCLDLFRNYRICSRNNLRVKWTLAPLISSPIHKEVMLWNNTAAGLHTNYHVVCMHI